MSLVQGGWGVIRVGGGWWVPQVFWCSQVVTASLHQRVVSGWALGWRGGDHLPMWGPGEVRYIGRSARGRGTGAGGCEAEPGPGNWRPIGSWHTGELSPDLQPILQTSASIVKIRQQIIRRECEPKKSLLATLQDLSKGPKRHRHCE